jgi:hypothetical protein
MAPAATEQDRPAASPATTAIETIDLRRLDRTRKRRRLTMRSRSPMGKHMLLGVVRYSETLILHGIRRERPSEAVFDHVWYNMAHGKLDFWRNLTWNIVPW